MSHSTSVADEASRLLGGSEKGSQNHDNNNNNNNDNYPRNYNATGGIFAKMQDMTSRLTRNMSTSAFSTIADEIARQQQAVRRRMSTSDVTGALNETAGFDDKNKNKDFSSAGAIESQGRRALYGSLPFVAAFGMQRQESKISRVLSSVSTNTLESLALQESTVRSSVLTLFHFLLWQSRTAVRL